MKANKYISEKSHQILLIAAFASFITAILSFASICIKIYNQDVTEIQNTLEREANYVNTNEPNFEVYVLASAPIAPFLILAEIFLTFVTFLFLLKPRFLFSTFSIAFSFSIFVFWLISTRYLVSAITDFPKPEGFEKILAHSNGFDFILLFLVSILFFWQTLILLRMLIKILQRKTEMP